MLADIKEKVNTMVERLVTLDTETESDEITKIQLQVNRLIIDKCNFKQTDAYGTDWYNFPLLDDLVLPFDTLLVTLEENLRKSKITGEWIFNPQEGNFILTIIKKSKFKVSRGDGLLKGYIQQEEALSSEDSHGLSKPDVVPEEGSISVFADEVDVYSRVIDKVSAQQEVIYIAGLIRDKSWLKNEGQEDKHHFEGYFTHDRVKEEKENDGIYITESYNAVIFPIMCQKLMQFLMEGRFAHLLDVARNPLRDGISLKERNKNVGDCYGMGTTEKYYSTKYRKWLESIKRPA